jgi:ribA/ribD-fused uncharacterized protein
MMSQTKRRFHICFATLLCRETHGRKPSWVNVKALPNFAMQRGSLNLPPFVLWSITLRCRTGTLIVKLSLWIVVWVIALQAKYAPMASSQVIPFYGAKHGTYGGLSNFYRAPFHARLVAGDDCPVESIAFSCNEQYIMANKAHLFKDMDALRQIMKESSPWRMKGFGRKVQHYDDVLWCSCREEVAYQGALHKFAQNPVLRKLLVETGTCILAEASASDREWGIGLSLTDARCHDKARWRGANLLGTVLMNVRNTLASSRDGGPMGPECHA